MPRAPTLTLSWLLWQVKMAVAARGGRVAGVMFHTDRGSTCTAGELTALCRGLGIRQSMGRVGSCFDNAARNRSSRPLNTRPCPRYHFGTQAEAKQHIVSWVCDSYNSRRRHSASGMQSPIDYEAAARPSDEDTEAA